MKITPTLANELMRSRRAVFPNMYNEKKIEKHILEDILENANWAPTHRHTEPWRFKVLQNKALIRLSQFLGNFYKKNTPESAFSAMKYKKTKQKPLQSACVIAICMQRDPTESLPEWEEIAAVACAVQNMWLSATAFGIGTYWSTPAAINEMNSLLDLSIGEKCLGLFYMGYFDGPLPKGKREAITDKVKWVDQ